MPTLFRYVVIDVSDNDTEYIFTDDASGWDELTTALIRGSFHGINSEQTAPLKFALEAREFLRNIFIQHGAFAKLKLRIDLRNEDWSYSEYVTYYFDFKTFNDDLDYVSIELKENSLRELIESKMDTEYDVDVFSDTSEIKNIGINKLPYISTNTVQCQTGHVVQFSSGKTNDNYVNARMKLRGVHTDNRSLSTHFKFTFDSGIPMDYTGFNVTNGITLVDDGATSNKVKVFVNLTMRFHVKTYISNGDNTTLTIRFVKDTGYNTQEYTLLTISPSEPITVNSYEYDAANNKYWLSVVYNYATPFYVYDTLLAGDNLALEFWIRHMAPFVFLGDSNSTAYTVNNSKNSRVVIENEVNSDGTYWGLYGFSHEHAIKKLIEKISPNAVLNYNLTHTNYLPALIANRTILDIYKTPFSFSDIKLKLSELLKSLDLLYNIGVNIDENNITIDYIDNFYTDNSNLVLEPNNVSLSFDDRYAFNNIIAGTDTSKELNVKYGIYSPFTKKQFTSESVVNSEITELELIHPYKIDQFSIEEWIQNLINNENKVKDDTATEIAVIALITSPIDYVYYPIRASYISPNFRITQGTDEYYNIPFTPKRILLNKIKSLTQSVYGSSTNKIIFASNKGALSYGLESKMPYEDANVVEDEDLDISDIDPLFLPLKISCSTVIDIEQLKAIKDNKYKYITITDREGNTYQCYISKLLAKIGKTSAQEYEFIVKSIQ